MVASFDEGQLTRSLVRVPDSGRDRTAGSVMWDLSTVSTMASMARIPRNLPFGIQHRNLHSDVSLTTPLQGTGPGPDAGSLSGHITGPNLGRNGILSSPISGPLASGAPSTGARGERKCPRPQTKVATAKGRHPSAKTSRTTSALPRTATVDQGGVAQVYQPIVATGTPASGPPTAAGIMLTPTTPQELLRERDQLRLQNIALKQQLSLFQQLFRDKEKLASVVRTLGIEVQ